MIKKKLKPIPPTMREKKRYALFTIKCSNKLNAKEVSVAVNESILSLFGSFGLAEINPKLIEWNPEKNTGIIRFNRSFKEKFLTALQFISRINSHTITINAVSVSGTLKTLREKREKC